MPIIRYCFTYLSLKINVYNRENSDKTILLIWQRKLFLKIDLLAGSGDHYLVKRPDVRDENGLFISMLHVDQEHTCLSKPEPVKDTLSHKLTLKVTITRAAHNVFTYRGIYLFFKENKS